MNTVIKMMNLGDPLIAREHILEFNWASKMLELDLIIDSMLKNK